jgi:hypothetical protein
MNDMVKLSKIIIQALRQMDPNDDTQWLSNGQPRIEAVRHLANLSSINRIEIDMVAPGFSRANMVLPERQGSDTANAPEEGATTEPETSEDAGKEDLEDPALEEEDFDEDLDLYESAREALKEAEAILNEKRAAFDIAKLELDKATSAYQQAVNEVETLRPQTANQTLIQNYLENQRKQNEQKAQFQKELIDSGLGPKTMLTLNKMLQKAPVDQVRVKARAFGFKK